MNASKILALVFVSLLLAILLASALNSYTRVSDSALAQVSPLLLDGGGQGVGSNTPRTTPGKNYLPIIFLNSATAGGAWLLSGNAGTNSLADFIGTTDNVTFTIRVSNTIAYRVVPTTDTPNIIGGFNGNSVAAGLYGATIAGGGTSGYANSITSAGYFATIGGGDSNVGSGGDATIGGGYNNTASGNYSAIGGGQTNNATSSYSAISGGLNNTASGYAATLGGGAGNIANGTGSFVGGGGFDGSTTSGNQAIGNASTIGGGLGNQIIVGGTYAFIGGGQSNASSKDYATVSGGDYNTASGTGATVGGGTLNTASGQNAALGGGGYSAASGSYSVVGGGSFNTASGGTATVPGGSSNVASGDYSFAAGYKANTNSKSGAFVWADSTGSGLNATLANQFLVRASGGITLYTNAGSTSGAALYPGSGSWNTLSNKNLKANFITVDSRAILAQVNALPITTWNYTTQDSAIRHIGPMAQDFAAAFKVGENDTTISTVDAQGVALAAIQGLSQVVQDKDAQIAAQQSEIAQLKNQNTSLDARVSALEQVPHPSTIDAGQASGVQSPNVLPISNDALFVGALVVIVGVVIGRRQRA